jgi:AraC-like DNA-binding protein
MKHWYQRPHAMLSSYVRTVLVIDGSSEPDAASPPLVTNGMAALFCKNNKVTLFGTSVPSEHWSVDEDTQIMAYFFWPFAAACIFNIDAKILAKAPIELGEPGDVEDFLIDKLKSNQRNCEIVKYSTDRMMIDPKADILSQLKLNERTFQRIFKKYVGITPAHYRRICQFELSFTQVRTKDFHSLTDVAYANGFADQSHFIRSFKEFTETTPVHYLKSGLNEKNSKNS